MANAFILSPHLSDAATLYASSQLQTMPVWHLQKQDPGRRWLATGRQERLYVQFPTPQAIDTVALGFASRTASTACQMRLGGSLSPSAIFAPPQYLGDWTSPITPQSFSDLPDCAILYLPPGNYWGALMIQVEDLALGGTVEASRLMVGKRCQPALNMTYDAAEAYGSVDAAERAYSGAAIGDRRGSQVEHTIPWDALLPTEVDELRRISRERGAAGDILLCLDADATTRRSLLTMRAVFVDKPTIKPLPHFIGSDQLSAATLSLRAAE
jgi:hypothetical protein